MAHGSQYTSSGRRAHEPLGVLGVHAGPGFVRGPPVVGREAVGGGAQIGDERFFVRAVRARLPRRSTRAAAADIDAAIRLRNTARPRLAVHVANGGEGIRRRSVASR